MEQMGFQIQHGGPDPHRWEHLDQGQPPVGEQQLQTFEKHGDGTDGERGGGEQPPGLAQLQNRPLHSRLVAIPDGADEPADLSTRGNPARRGLFARGLSERFAVGLREGSVVGSWEGFAAAFREAFAASLRYRFPGSLREILAAVPGECGLARRADPSGVSRIALLPAHTRFPRWPLPAPPSEQP